MQRNPIPALCLVLTAACTLLFPGGLFSQSGTLFVENDRVGLGIETPDYKLDVRGADDPATRIQVTDTSSTTTGRTLFKLENNGFPRFVMRDSNTGDQWLMAVAGGGDFFFNKTGSGAVELRSSPGGDLEIAGEMTATGYNTSSSRSFKEGLTLVDGQEILDAVVTIPVAEWSFKGEKVRHLGPMSEDFRSAFGLGESTRHIGLMDAAGVNMAAIQGLHSLITERDRRINELEARIEQLENLVEAVASNAGEE